MLPVSQTIQFHDILELMNYFYTYLFMFIFENINGGKPLEIKLLN